MVFASTLDHAQFQFYSSWLAFSFLSVGLVDKDVNQRQEPGFGFKYERDMNTCKLIFEEEKKILEEAQKEATWGWKV